MLGSEHQKGMPRNGMNTGRHLGKIKVLIHIFKVIRSELNISTSIGLAATARHCIP